jgi:hypothetical protein
MLAPNNKIQKRILLCFMSEPLYRIFHQPETVFKQIQIRLTGPDDDLPKAMYQWGSGPEHLDQVSDSATLAKV